MNKFTSDFFCRYLWCQTTCFLENRGTGELAIKKVMVVSSGLIVIIIKIISVKILEFDIFPVFLLGFLLMKFFSTSILHVNSILKQLLITESHNSAQWHRIPDCMEWSVASSLCMDGRYRKLWTRYSSLDY